MLLRACDRSVDSDNVSVTNFLIPSIWVRLISAFSSSVNCCLSMKANSPVSLSNTSSTVFAPLVRKLNMLTGCAPANGRFSLQVAPAGMKFPLFLGRFFLTAPGRACQSAQHRDPVLLYKTEMKQQERQSLRCARFQTGYVFTFKSKLTNTSHHLVMTRNAHRFNAANSPSHAILII